MRAAFVLLLTLLVVAVTQAPSGETASKVLRSELDGESVLLTMPTGGEPKGLAIWYHGQGGNVNDRIDGPFLGALRRDGWAVASSDFHLQSWGNEASTADAEALVAWAEEEAGLPVSLWVSGSMGGAVSLNALVHGVEPPPCWYGVKPAIALTQLQTVPTAPRFIQQAYGGPVPADRNPVRNLLALPDDVRYRVVASPDDALVPLRENGGAMLSTLTGAGYDITYLQVQGSHEDPSHWNSGDLVEFAGSCLDRETDDAGE